MSRLLELPDTQLYSMITNILVIGASRACQASDVDLRDAMTGYVKSSCAELVCGARDQIQERLYEGKGYE